MTRRESGSFAAKQPSGAAPDPQVAALIRAGAAGGEYACHQAEELAAQQQISLAEVGAMLDLLEIRINRCQLGLFGYTPESRIVKPLPVVKPELAEAVRGALVNGRLPCLAAWTIARAQGIPRMDVACACETLQIKVKPCQLGAF